MFDAEQPRRPTTRDPGRMLADLLYGSFGERFPGLGPMPGRSARRVRQRCEIEGLPPFLDPDHLANDPGQGRDGSQELTDRQFPNGNDQLRPEEIELCAHPGVAMFNFLPRRNTITALLVLSGKTAANCSHVHCRAKRQF